jgi:hypothetical protein
MGPVADAVPDHLDGDFHSLGFGGLMVGAHLAMLIAMDAATVFNVEMKPGHLINHRWCEASSVSPGCVEDGASTATPLVHRGLSLLQLLDQRLDPLLGQWVKSLLGEFAVSRYLLRKLLAFFTHETWLTAFGLGGSTTHSLSQMDAASRSMMT